MKEQILEAFRELGFNLNKVDELGYSFNYEEMNLLYLNNNNDENFLSIALPGIMEVDDNQPLKAYALMEKINSSQKYVKSYMIGNNVWVFYERELYDNEPDLERVLAHMVLHLNNTFKMARIAINEIEETMNNDDDTNKD